MTGHGEASSYVARVERTGPATISGYVYHRDDHALRLVVELLIDGLPVALARAEIYRPDLDGAGIGDGRYGFSFVLSPDVVASGGTVQVVLANRDEPLAPPLVLGHPTGIAPQAEGGAGAVEWAGGLLLTGWLAPRSETAQARVRAVIDGETVAEGPADRWRQRGRGGVRPVPGFVLHLPERLADGLAKRVVVTDGAGTHLGGSPVALVAFPDPLEQLALRAYGPETGGVAQRARLFDALSPATAPLAGVQAWLRRFPDPAPAPTARSWAIVLVGDEPEAVTRTRASVADASGLVSLIALPSPDGIGFAPADLLAFLTGGARDVDQVILAPAGTRFVRDAPARLAAALGADPETHLVYGDALIGAPGAETILAWPSFDYERWLEQGYGARLFALPRERAVSALNAGAGDLYRLALAQIDDPVRARRTVLHLPGIAATLPPLNLAAATRRLSEATAAHLQARAIPARIRPGNGAVLPAIRVEREPSRGTVSLLVTPGRDRDGLAPRLEALRPALDRIGGELLVLGQGALAPDGARPWSPARAMNRMAAAAKGDLLCYLDGDLEIRDEGWLLELLGRLREPSTAAVGAVVRSASGLVHHGGLVLGPGFGVGEALTDHLADEPGPGDLLRVAHEPSALAAGCLLLRRCDIFALGGFDEVRFPVHYPALDLCLRLGARGARVVLSPHLDLVRVYAPGAPEPARKGVDPQRSREVAALRARWGGVLAADPAYSPLLGLTDPAYAALACPPRPRVARRRNHHRSDDVEPV